MGRRSDKWVMPREEMRRRVTLNNLQRLFVARYGGWMFPADDAGREDLEELLLWALDKTMRKLLNAWAPWMLDDEADRLIARIQSMPTYMRRSSPAQLGKVLNVTNAERERL